MMSGSQRSVAYLRRKAYGSQRVQLEEASDLAEDDSCLFEQQSSFYWASRTWADVFRRTGQDRA